MKDTPIKKQLKRVADSALKYIDIRVTRLKNKEKSLWLSVEEGQITYITKRNGIIQVNIIGSSGDNGLCTIKNLSLYSIIQIAVELETPVK